jgi:glycosyltransferase involved in cell wall biosynthesis
MLDDEEPLLSIIVAVGDYQRFLSSYLGSIPDVNSNRIEFIFVVNTDEKQARLHKYFEGFQARYIVVCGNYDNPGSARNAGIALSHGKWITFHDVDDEPYIDHILDLATLLENSEYEIGCGTFITTTYGEKTVVETFKWSRKKINDVARRPGIWRMLFKREIVINERFLPLSMGEDQHFLFLIRFATRRVMFSNLQIYNYKVGVPNQLTSNKSKYHDLIKVQEQEKLLIKEVNDYIEVKFMSRMILRQGITLLKAYISPARIFTITMFLVKINAISTLRKSKVKKVVSKNHEVLVFLTGGLGNQLFQIAAALAVAGERNVKVLPWGNPSLISGVPESEMLIWPANVVFEPVETLHVRRIISFLLRRGLVADATRLNPMSFFLKQVLKIYLLLRGGGWISVHINSGIGFSPFKKTIKSTLLVGYFQSYIFPETWCKSGSVKYLENGEALNFDEHPKINKIAIHIRLGDYLNEDSFGIPDESYYLKAIEMIPNTKNFFIDLFTNSPELVFEYYPNLPWERIEVRHSDEESSIDVLSRMTKYKYLVIGNSTFSWWAAYLSRFSDIVVYPAPWFKDLESPSMLCHPSWSPCDATFRKSSPVLVESDD